MKFITANLVKFAAVFAVFTITFRFLLGTFIDAKLFMWIWILALVYFCANFVIGWYFGKKDHECLPLFDVGFRFHFTTYFVFNLLSEIWFLLGFQSASESIRTVHSTAIIWGGFIIIHFIMYLIYRKKSINGLEKSEIFD
ncbi:MAG: hypothetical protein E6772_11730 [Dysgonomonas sp.]|nr:hypothetical protein [Dysgonomonas sp.]